MTDGMAEGALSAIKALLDDGGIPRGTFADDQVRNLVALYNQRGDAINRLEAQCAAMRKVLNNLYVLFISHTRSPRMDSNPINLHDLIEVIHKALSPDAGEKVLDVVRAAEEVRECAAQMRNQVEGVAWDVLDPLLKALSALGRKP